MRGTSILLVGVLSLCVALLLQAQTPQTSYLVLSRDGRRPLPATPMNGQDFVALDDLVAVFAATVREDALAGGFTLSVRGRTIVAVANQPTVSVNGKVVPLPAPVTHSGRRWLVPVEFIQVALGPIWDQRLQVRKASHLVIVGDLRVPRVTVRIETAGPPTRAVVDAAPAAAITSTIENGRVLLKFDADALDIALPADGGGLITQLRSSDQPNAIAIQLDAAAGAVRTTPAGNDAASRLILEVQGASPSPAPAPAPAPAQPATETSTTRPATPPVPASTGPVTPESLTASRGVLQTIIIDPGHGGDDIGTKAARGIEEKQLTLDVARRLKTLLETRLGVRVLLTRDGDTSVPLDARIAFANNHNGDLFLSIHGNAAPSSAVEGAEVYYLLLDREGEQARAEAARTAVAIPVIGGGTRTLDLVPWELAQARHIEASAMLANAVAQDLGSRIPVGPSPIRRAPLRVLEGVDMPAALVEVAFLSSPTQEKLARSDDFKSMAAQGLFDAVARFRAQLEELRSR